MYGTCERRCHKYLKFTSVYCGSKSYPWPYSAVQCDALCSRGANNLLIFASDWLRKGWGLYSPLNLTVVAGSNKTNETIYRGPVDSSHAVKLSYVRVLQYLTATHYLQFDINHSLV